MVQQQVGFHTGIFFKLLDVVPVGATVDLPVDVANVVSLDVFPKLSELNVPASVVTAVRSRDEAIDNGACPQSAGPVSAVRLEFDSSSSIISI